MLAQGTALDKPESARSRVRRYDVADHHLRRPAPMAMITPNDRSVVNAVAQYEREIMGRPLAASEILRIAEAAKRMIQDEIHAQKSR